ncbi:MAG: serine/threonine protein kinase [Deltaproteobacteria bacterium]|nr:serine/threonine protein kinase [Deltaproteobacteria bacterium]
MSDTLATHDDGEAGAPSAASRQLTEGMLTPGTIVDHFRVTRLLGRGGMGEVYAARDLRLGRRVALKIVAPGHFTSESMRERFLVEAQTTARFSHPNIVTIYAVGELDGSPYLALEYLEGQTLVERLLERPATPGEAIRLALPVAEALAEAHRHGVLHRDLKPGNIHLGRDGRVRVLDFGLAKIVREELGSTARLSRAAIEETFGANVRSAFDELASKTFGVGTPAYMAPEQWLEDPCTGATDVWAFGVVLFATLTGRMPFPGATVHALALEICGNGPIPRVSSHADVPSELDALVSSCLSRNAEERPTMARLVEVLQGMIAGSTRVRAAGASPFRGLLPFTREHEHLFFGRDAETAAFVERLRSDCVLPVVGASGSGKSSFVQAGVIPRLVAQERWTVLVLRVGPDPFAALAARLVEGDDNSSPSNDTTQAFDAPTRVKEPVSAKPARPRGELQTVLLEDSDDGTVAPSSSLAPAFAPRTSTTSGPFDAALTRSGQHRRDVIELAQRLRETPAQVAFELRALADSRRTRVLLCIDQLEELFTQGVDDQVVHAFVEALCSASDDPLDPVRVIFTIRDDFFGRLAVSPRVSAALGRVTLMQRPDARALVDVLNGPVTALGYAFEDARLPEEMVQAVKDEPGCLPLLQFTANLLWEHRDRERKLLTRAAYVAVGGVEGALARHADGVLTGLGEPQLKVARQLLMRLVTPERTRKVLAKEIALEGLGDDARQVLGRLIEARLVTTTKWLDQRSTTVLELAHEALIRNWGTLRRWVDESHEDVVLLGQLEQAARLWNERGQRAEQLWRGDALAEARRHLARAPMTVPTAVREFVEMSGRASEGRRSRKRLLFGSGILVAAATAVSSILAAFTIAHQRDRAERGRSEALREGARAALAQGLVLEARAKVREALEAEDSVATRVLWRQLEENPLDWTAALGARVYGVAYAPDGRRVVAGGSDGTVTLLDAVTRERRTLRGHTDQVLSVDVAPNGEVVASAGLDRTVRVWDASRGTLLRVLGGHRDAVHTARFSPDGRRIVAGSYSGEVRVYNVNDGKEVLAWRAHETPVRGVAVSPDGRTLATGDASGKVKLWSAETAAPGGDLAGNDHTVVGLVFRADGAELATSSLDGTVRLFDVKGRREVAVMRGHSAGLYRLAYSPDGQELASAGSDRVVHVWDVKTRAIVRSYPVHGEATDVAFSRDGEHLAVSSVSEEVSLFRARVSDKVGVRGHDAVVNQAALSADGALAASAANDGRLIVRDARSGAVLLSIDAHQGPANAVSFLPDGHGLVSGGGDGAVRQWTLKGEAVRTLLTHPSAIYVSAVSPDGHTIAAGSHDGAVLVVDARSGSVRKLGQGQDRVRTVAFDGAGRRLVAAGHDGHLRVWTTDDGKLERDVDLKHGRIYGAAIEPEGKTAVAATADGSLFRVPLDGAEPQLFGDAKVRCYGMSFAHDGASLLAPCADGKLRIFPTSGGEPRVVDVHDGEVNTVSLTKDGALVLTASDDFTIDLLDARDFRPRWFTRAVVPIAPLGTPADLAARGLVGSAVALTQRGWTTPSGQAVAVGDRAFTDLVARASRASVSGDGTRLCVTTADDKLTLHDVTTDRTLVRQESRATELLATARGCFALDGGSLVRVDASGKRSVALAGGLVLGDAEDGVLVATDARILALDDELRERHSFATSGVVTALAAAGGQLVVGYRDGHLERRSIASGEGMDLEGTSASPVSRIVGGPGGVWIAGFGSGELGMWSRDDVRRLDRTRLHGPVDHLVVARGLLHAGTRRGDGLTWDLRDLARPRCDLLDAVHAVVPVLWRDGRAVVTPGSREACR